jgi:hypothetical protein
MTLAQEPKTMKPYISRKLPEATRTAGHNFDFSFFRKAR